MYEFIRVGKLSALFFVCIEVGKIGISEFSCIFLCGKVYFLIKN